MNCRANRQFQVFTAFAGTVACAFIIGCSTASIPISSGFGNNLHLDNAAAIDKPLPTDNGRPQVQVFVANVECNALVTGRPLELVSFVRKSVMQHLASSKNFAVLATDSAASYVVQIKVSTFERGIKTQSNQQSADLVLESSRGRENRRGILELQVAVADPVTLKLIHGFSVMSETEDSTSTKRTGFFGFSAVGVSYQRKSDNDVVSKAAHIVALELWARLINPTEPVQNVSKQQ